ncbi:hypothetical protein J7E62_32555 [Variovorax paradoxus]|nr:hypothetical protein [Variovorax paradoxus]
MKRVDLHTLPPGAEIEVQEAAVFPIIQNGPMHAYLCADDQMRIVTTAGGHLLFGGPTREALFTSLEKLGFKPVTL